LAGCNVGKYPRTTDDIPQDYLATELEGLFSTAPNETKPHTAGPLKIVDPKHSFCTSWDGQRFLCDTNYKATMKMTVEDLTKQLSKEEHICITGGEPFLHDLEPLVQAMLKLRKMVHIETSGTLPMPPFSRIPWITCCPKAVDNECLVIDRMLVDEWKILVGPEFDEKQLEWMDKYIPRECVHRYIQPINGILDIWRDNMDRCLDLLTRWPHWKLSSQLHKFIQVR